MVLTVGCSRSPQNSIATGSLDGGNNGRGSSCLSGLGQPTVVNKDIHATEAAGHQIRGIFLFVFFFFLGSLVAKRKALTSAFDSYQLVSEVSINLGDTTDLVDRL